MKQAIETPTKELYDEVVKHCLSKGMQWQNKKTSDVYHIFEEETILHIDNNVLSVGNFVADGFELINNVNEII